MLLRVLLVAPAVLISTVWACAALWLDGPASRAVAGLLVAGFALGAAGLLGWVRPFRRGLLGFALLFLAVLAWWLSIEPSNDRAWQPDVARPPTATVRGDRVTIENVRNFDYRTEDDYTERWEERTYDLSKLRGADLFLSYWGSPWIAHTIMSWEFDNGQHLAISIETRKEKGESYSALRGFFRQYELYYVVADERDVVRLRTNYRGEDVYLYHLTAPPERARAVLLHYLEEINGLARRPKWYNAATLNCTTAIRHHVQQVAPANPWNWRILVNGRLDELGYMRGTIDTSLPFEELKRRSAIVEKARAADQDPEFSERIRAGLPRARPAASAQAPEGSQGRTRPVRFISASSSSKKNR
jgi:hypothetical protein